jgi:GTP-binding protein Era
MLAFSYDPDAGTIYTYFTELEADQAQYTLEYPATLLLDDAGQFIGFSLDLDDEITVAALELALEDDPTRLDGTTGRLTIVAVDATPAQRVRLDETAILDLDDDERVLGIEIVLPKALRDPARLERLGALLLPLDDMPDGGEGPVVFQEEAGGAQEEAGGAQEEAGAEGAAGLQSASAPDQAESHPSGRGDATPTRAGFVALVGKPNVGKSTLLNALLGQKLAIVSPRPQTTRVPLRGVLHRPDAQIIFIDTPGIHQPSHRLGKLMVELAERTLPNADVIGFMVDISQPPSQLDRRIAAQVQRARAPKLLILNKVDAKPRRQGASYLDDYRVLGAWDMELAISAQRRMGLDLLLEEIVARLPESPPLYPEDQLTDQTEQQLAAEYVREKALYYTQQEVPHAVAVEVDEWTPKDGATYIRMTINVERKGQKAILIGTGGAMLKKIGSAARADIERLIGGPVYLDLWVKVRENWRDDTAALGWLGYRAKDIQ